MKFVQFILIVAIYLVAAHIVYGQNEYTPAIYVYKDKVYDGGGTGILIQNNLVLTNQHIVRNADRLVNVVFFPFSEDRQVEAGEVIKTDEGNDLALIKIAPVLHTSVYISRTPIRVGETVECCGYPLMNKHLKVSGRVLGEVTTIKKKPSNAFFFRGDVSSGMSGGPVTNMNGELVGITFGCDVIRDRYNNVLYTEGYFTGSEAILKFLKGTPYALQ